MHSLHFLVTCLKRLKTQADTHYNWNWSGTSITWY